MALDIITDARCSRTMDVDMALGSTDITVAPLVAQAI